MFKNFKILGYLLDNQTLLYFKQRETRNFYLKFEKNNENLKKTWKKIMESPLNIEYFLQEGYQN